MEGEQLEPHRGPLAGTAATTGSAARTHAKEDTVGAHTHARAQEEGVQLSVSQQREGSRPGT